MYSEQAVQLIKDYKAAFPELFDAVNKDPTASFYDSRLFFGDNYQDKLQAAVDWLAKSPIGKCN